MSFERCKVELKVLFLSRYEIRIGGFGGQGVVTMAMVAAETASLFDKKFVVQTQSYGPEARGGASKSEIVISDEEIDYPKVLAPDVFVVLSRAAYLEYIDGLKENGTLIIDEDLVEIEGTLPKGVKVFKIPATRIADKDVGNKQATNVVMLGAFTVITKALSIEGLKARIEERWPRFIKSNMLALELGMKAGNDALQAQA
ncbi:2-oxoacid:ferredoxin oxidoreductase subunit gamma [Candidatus Thorarchaeota archaeon]|nr:MAG: 2-oxoacid:ferredoxin oxidoreductase subunit gamma [Candidatus Thorarchaeota archaeon]